MKVPNEILLDILQTLDYSTLLRLKFTAARFYHAIVRNTASLAKRMELSLWIYCARVSLEVDGEVIFKMDYDSSDSFEMALIAAAEVVALHPIVSVQVWCKAIESGLADAISSYLPSTTFALRVSPYCISQTQLKTTQLEAFISRFPWLQSVDLDRIPIDFDWTILRSKYLLRLPVVDFSPYADAVEKERLTLVAQAEIFRFCRDFSELWPGMPKLLSLWGGWQFSQGFVDRVAQPLGTREQ